MTIIKRLLLCFLSSVLCFVCAPKYEAYATEPQLQYTNVGGTPATVNTHWGPYSAYCTFTVDQMVGNRFRGSFTVTNIPIPYVNTNVEGSFVGGDKSLTFMFSDSSYYNANFVFTAKLNEGRCICQATCSQMDWDTFVLTGDAITYDYSIDSTLNANANYKENDMKMCMFLSNSVYDENISQAYYSIGNTRYYAQIPCSISSAISRGLYSIDSEPYFSGNYLDTNKDNVAYTICHRENENDIDIIVVLRGSLKDEWTGNFEITGTSYNSELERHYSFNLAKEFIMPKISEYYSIIDDTNKPINLIITGHSRGAAVANLYAKDATDGTNGIPSFNKVTAYTFATPNVAKYNSGMENYYNIFNFCFTTDIVPTIPLTQPIDGWNYWKYGLTYVSDLTDLDNQYYYDSKLSLLSSSYTVYDVWEGFKSWNSVAAYYNKPIFSDDISAYPTTTLYRYLHDGVTRLMSGSRLRLYIGAINTLYDYKHYKELKSFTQTLIGAIPSLGASHAGSTYWNIINSQGASKFERTYYQFNNARNSNLSRNSRDSIVPDSYELGKLRDLYDYSNNSELLDWNFNDPAAFTGITWNSSGHITSIDLSYLDLEGTLDLSDFSAIENVNIAGNKLTSIDVTDCDSLINLNVSANNVTEIDVSDCTDLETLDCSFNDLSTNGLSVTGSTALTMLKCDNCGLTTLTVSTLTDLEELSCAFNNLTDLDIDHNAALTSLTCCYNYLDIHKGSDLYGDFDELMFSDVYVNYYPQAVPANATFNPSELNALMTFALADNNNDALDWLDENDNIDTDKLQNNVLFEYDGSNYRVVAIDIADAEVEGALNLTALAKLQELYCENTGITSLNVNGCTVLNTLSCDNCEISSLTLPSNASAKNTPLYNVSCEYNHINTSIFTTALDNNGNTMADFITFKAGATLEYESQKYEDSDALEAALSFSNRFRSEDYTEESFSVLAELLEEYGDFENMLLTQDDVDEMTTEIITAINELVPYLKLITHYKNGTVSITKDGQPVSTYYTSALSGTPITLTATPDTGYEFKGWFETYANRIFSTSSTYSFDLTTNLTFEALFVPVGSVTLTFTNDTGQIVDTVSKTTTEWANVTSLSDLLPDVPYKLGHTGGQWNYVESDILTALANGTDCTIAPTYNTSTFVYPTVPTPVDNEPVCNLTHSYNDEDNICSFIMAAGIPQNLDIEAIGVAFYKVSKTTVIPSDFELTLNKRCIVSRFDGRQSDGLYIVNVHSFFGKYKWCVRGFVTYHDGDDLVTVYTNQLESPPEPENNQRVLISRNIDSDDNNTGGGIDHDYDPDPF